MIGSRFRQTLLILLAVEAAAATFVLGYFLWTDQQPTVVLGLLILVPLILALFALAWRGYRGVAQANTVITAVLAVTLLINPASDTSFSPVFFAPIALALITTDTRWMAAISGGMLLVTLVRAGGQGPYASFDHIVTMLFTISCLALGRLMLERAYAASQAALNEAAAARDTAQGLAATAEARAAELAEQNTRQQRLLDLVKTLETPAIEVAPGVLLAPIVGYFDQQRAAQFVPRLLSTISAKQIRALIIDISAISELDAAGAATLRELSQAVRLLGCTPVVSGITPPVAQLLTRLRLDFGAQTIATPDLALATLNHA